MSKRKTNVIFVQELEKTDHANPAYDPQGQPPNFPRSASRNGVVEDGDETARDVTNTRLYDILKPLFLLMKLFGLFYAKRFSPKGGITPCRIYCLIITLCVVLNFGRSLTGYRRGEEFGPLMFFKMCITLWWCECATKAVTCYISSTKQTMLYDFFVTWDNTCSPENAAPYEKKMRKFAKSAVTQIVVLTLINVVATGYAMFGPPELVEFFDISLTPLPTDHPNADIFRAFNLVLHLLNTVVALVPLNLYKLICLALYYEFKQINEKLVSRVGEDGEFFGDLEELRLQHQKVCKLVEAADELFTFFIAGALTANIPLVCLMLYNLIYFHLHISQIVLEAFWVFMITVHCSIVLAMGALVNNEAHKPLDNIYSIRVRGDSINRNLQSAGVYERSMAPQNDITVNMFLNKLTGTSIGVTALDMFVLNKPTILTVIGMILTYFVVLLQFKMPGGENMVCNCNITGLSEDGLTNGTMTSS